MIPEVKAMWLEALRSGDYPQGTGKLAKRNRDTGQVTGYCCLGVLCARLATEGLYGVTAEVAGGTRPDRVIFTYEEESQTGVLPGNLARDLGIASRVVNGISLEVFPSNPDIPVTEELRRDARLQGALGPTTSSVSLAHLNDKGFSFTEIADLIEAYF